MKLTGIIKLTHLLLGSFLSLACLYGLPSFIVTLLLACLVSLGLDLFLAKVAKNG
ncbi:hypothetical protein SN10121_07750 [Ligilactobacillus agilis]|nr:hypothetical protein SN10121_07750 [Ligilactobacillus agilis]